MQHNIIWMQVLPQGIDSDSPMKLVVPLTHV